MKYIVFGAGKLGMEALKYYGEDKVVAFCDNDICKHGTEYCGKPVVSFFEMLSMLNDNTIVVASRYQREMVDQLAEHNVKNYDIYIPRLTERLETVDREAIFYKKNVIVSDIPGTAWSLKFNGVISFKNEDYISLKHALLKASSLIINEKQLNENALLLEEYSGQKWTKSVMKILEDNKIVL